jgi:hypothetical protein
MANCLRRVDWGHVAFVLFIAGAVSWYFVDAYTASSNIKNLILIAPASGLALLFCVIILVQDARKALAAPPQAAAPVAAPPTAPGNSAKPTDGARFGSYRAVAFIVLFGLYVGLLEVIGYDVATWLFIAAAMVMNGERQPLVIAGFSLAFGSLAVWLFGLLLPYPMLTLVVPN